MERVRFFFYGIFYNEQKLNNIAEGYRGKVQVTPAYVHGYLTGRSVAVLVPNDFVPPNLPEMKKALTAGCIAEFFLQSPLEARAIVDYFDMIEGYRDYRQIEENNYVRTVISAISLRDGKRLLSSVYTIPDLEDLYMEPNNEWASKENKVTIFEWENNYEYNYQGKTKPAKNVNISEGT